MKNSNLLNRLLSYSHEKQTPQRFARYAAMLIMLLTLGIGQMWADNEYNKRYLYVNSSNCSWWTDASAQPSLDAYWKIDDYSDGQKGGYQNEATAELTSTSWYFDLYDLNSSSYLYFRGFKVQRHPKGTSDYWSAVTLGANGSSNKNCLWINSEGNGMVWGTYAPPMESVTITNTSTVYGGDGSEANPYKIKKGTTLTVSASSTSSVPGDAMTKYYEFYYKQGSGAQQTWRSSSTTTTSPDDLTVSSSVDVTYEIEVKAQNEYYGYYGTKASNKMYFVTVDPIYAILGDFNSWDRSAATWDLSDHGSNNWDATFDLDKGSYTFKVVYNSTHYGNGATISRGSSSTTGLSTSGDNMTITADVTGEYTFRYNSSDKTLAVTYPTAYRINISHGWKAASGTFSANTNPASAKGGTITSAVASASGSITDGENVASGENVVFTHSTAATGYSFLGWGSTFNNGATPPSYTAYTHNGTTIVINDASKTLTLNNITANKNVYSFFKENVTTVTVNAAAGHSGFGSLKFGATDKSWGATTTVGVTTTQSITAVPNPGYKFKRWTLSGGATLVSGALTDATITIKGNGTDGSTGTAVAEFELRYAVVGSVYGTSAAGSGMPGWDDFTKTLEYNASNDFRRTLTLKGNTKFKFRIKDKQTGNILGGESEYNISLNGTHTTFDKTGGDVTFTTEGSGDITFQIDGFSSGYPQVKLIAATSPRTITFGSRSVYNEGASADNSTNGGSVAVVDGYTYSLTSGQYVENGGTAVFTATAETGYTFAGWYSNSTCTTEIEDNDDDIEIEDNVLTLSKIGANKTVYAKFTENMTTVTIDVNDESRGTITVGGAAHTWGNTTTAGVTTGRALSVTANTGYYFAGWTKTEGTDYKLGSDADSDYEEDSKTPTLKGKGAGEASGQILTARFEPLEKVYFRNWNEDSNAALWSKVYVYFSTSTEGWSGSGMCAKTNSSADYKTEMTREGTSNIYWAYVPRGTTRNNDVNIAFSNTNFTTNFKFNTGEGVMRGDYKIYYNTFVPQHSDTETKNGTKYYKGYWKNHNKNNGEDAGYYLKRFNGSSYEDAKGDHKFTIADDNTIICNLRLDNTTSGYNKYMVAGAAGDVKYITSPAKEYVGPQITSSNNSNVPMQEWASGSPYFEIIPTSEGNYVLTINQTGDRMKISVSYPVSPGDYRIRHSYTDGGTKYSYSDIIKKGTTSDKVSMYIRNTSGTLMIAKCSGLDANKKPVWTTGIAVTGYTADNFPKAGVYVFDLALVDGNLADPTVELTSATISNAAPYTGDYYIKTDCAPGGWVNYTQNVLDKNTINASDFDYYFCKNVANQTNVKFVIANDYNIQVTDTIIQDLTYLTTSGDGTSKEYMPESSCIRFSYNSATNEAKRAYLRYSNNNNFLNIIPSAASTVYDAASAGNDLYNSGNANANNKFGNDDGNFVYRKTVYALSGATIDVKAEYNSNTQEFVSDKTLITSSDDAELYPVRVVYDFKTNHLTMAWEASTDLTDKLSNTEFLYIRNGQNAAGQVSLESGGEVNNSKVCGVFQFDYNDYVGKVGAWPQQTGQDAGYTYSKCMFYFSFPFDVNVSDIFGLGTYGKEWKLQYYDGAERAKKGFFRGDGTTTFWKDVPADSVLTKNVGYSLLLDNDYFNTTADGMVFEGKSAGGSVYLYFPSANAITLGQGATSIDVPSHECTLSHSWTDEEGKTLYHSNTDSHWNMMGVPLFQSQTGNFSATFKSVYDAKKPFGYLYAWDPSENSLNIADASDFTFKSMNAYMVQYTGTVKFSGSNVASIVAAPQRKEERNYTIDLAVLNSNDEHINRTYVELREGASDDFELNEDVYMTLNGKNVNVYSYAGDYDVAANVLSVANHTVPVGVTVKANGTYKFSMPSNFSGTVTLVDKFAQTRTNLAIEDYEVTLNKGTINDRFELEININKTPTAIDGVESGEGTLKDGKAHKFIMNDMLYIIRDGRIYDATGVLVK